MGRSETYAWLKTFRLQRYSACDRDVFSRGQPTLLRSCAVRRVAIRFTLVLFVLLVVSGWVIMAAALTRPFAEETRREEEDVETGILVSAFAWNHSNYWTLLLTSKHKSQRQNYVRKSRDMRMA